MEAIGERINGQFLDVKKAIKEKDKLVIQDLAADQTKAGAAWLDVNTGTAAADPEDAMRWLVETIQETCDTPLCIDSQKTPVLKAGLEAATEKAQGKLLLNSIAADPEKLEPFLGLVVEHNCSFIGLTMDAEGVSQNVDKRVENAATIVALADAMDISPDRIYIDPIILPANVGQDQPNFIMQALDQIKMISDPAPKTTCGLSNVSNSCAERHLINRIMLVMLAAHGLDSAIVDVFDKELMDAWITADLLSNKFIYSDSYLAAARS